MRTVFLHGAGRPGSATWAAQAAVADQHDWVFLDRADGVDRPVRDAERILAALLTTQSGGSGHVLSGRSAPLDDEVAAALVALGAELRVLLGTGHRPHDHPDATRIMIDFWHAHDRS